MKVHGTARTCPHCRNLIVTRYLQGNPLASVASEFQVTAKTVLKWVRRYETKGLTGLSDKSSRPHRIARRHPLPDSNFEAQLFSILHSPPTEFGFNRTTWKQDDLQQALKDRGYSATKATIAKVVKAAGYRWVKARRVLTSSDPDYRAKLDRIKAVLATLGKDEAFFSIDEYGPFKVCQRGGKTLAPRGQQPTVPQWQKSKGNVIITAALELSRNRVTHFYSETKNTEEIIKLLTVLLEEYKDCRVLYLSWDAASWHDSAALMEAVKANNGMATVIGSTRMELLPLPTTAQYLNVIEGVFNGMARSIIHNSDYQSVEEAKQAIDRYFADRNTFFLDCPRKAGKKIWGSEANNSEFNEAKNFKNPAYR